MVGVDGIIITKLDGTAKGGSIFSIAYALELPILYVGTGEQPQDLTPFDKYEFVDGLLDAIFEEAQGKPQEEIQQESQEEIEEEIQPEKTQKEILLDEFLKEERLLFLKETSQNIVLVNYANTPVDTKIEFKNNKWQYIK